MARLRELGAERGVAVSELVRAAIHETYFSTPTADEWRATLDKVSGIWADRDDMDPERYIRRLREESERKHIWQ